MKDRLSITTKMLFLLVFMVFISTTLNSTVFTTSQEDFASNVTGSHLDKSKGGPITDSSLPRFQSAIDAELFGAAFEAFNEMMKRIESLPLDDITSQRLKRVCFVHSSTLSKNNVNVLEEMLVIIHHAGLLSELDALWVLNYGFQVPHHIKKFKLFANITWVEMGPSASLFEVPTLEVLRRFSMKAVKASPDLQVLYVHTKGASYTRRYEGIEHWRNMMMYFLVEEHRACYHLLASDAFDILGVNRYLRMFSGNFWWARASYIATLRPFNENDKKYDSEYWILTGIHI